MGSKSRDKGSRGEREVVLILREYGLEAQRGAGLERASNTMAAKEYPDVVCGDLWIEVKVGKRSPNIRAAMDQARGDATDDQMPVVISKRDRERWLITMDLRDFLDRSRLHPEADHANNSGC